MASPSVPRSLFSPLLASRIPCLARCTRTQFLNGRTQHKPARCAQRGFASSVTAREKRYTRDHEWIELDPSSKIGTIGISTYAAKALGDVVFVELPAVDLEVSAGDAIGAVESVKSASDIMTPVTGKIVEANSVLEEKPSTINNSPEQDGWLARIEVGEQGQQEVQELMDQDGYLKFTEEADGH